MGAVVKGDWVMIVHGRVTQYFPTTLFYTPEICRIIYDVFYTPEIYPLCILYDVTNLTDVVFIFAASYELVPPLLRRY